VKKPSEKTPDFREEIKKNEKQPIRKIHLPEKLKSLGK
jgi:hypothetical protein